MIRRVTEEERGPVWTQFACAALTGLMTQLENYATTEEIVHISCEVADKMMDEWLERMDAALDLDEEHAESQKAENGEQP